MISFSDEMNALIEDETGMTAQRISEAVTEIQMSEGLDEQTALQEFINRCLPSWVANAFV